MSGAFNAKVADSFFKDMNIIKKGAYAGDISFKRCVVRDCVEDTTCPANCCRIRYSVYAEISVKEFYRYKKTGAEFNKNRGGGYEQFPSDDPIEMPEPTVERETPAGMKTMEFIEYWRKNKKVFTYRISGPKDGKCVNKKKWEEFEMKNPVAPQNMPLDKK